MADGRIAVGELLRKYKDDTEENAVKEGLVLLVQELPGGGGEGEDPRPGGTSERKAGARTATGTARGGGTPGQGRSRCGFPRSGTGATSQGFWNLAEGWRRQCCRWSRSRTSTR